MHTVLSASLLKPFYFEAQKEHLIFIYYYEGNSFIMGKKGWQIWKYDCDLGRVPEMGESDAFIFRGSLTAAFIPLITPVWLMSYFVHFSLCLAFV